MGGGRHLLGSRMAGREDGNAFWKQRKAGVEVLGVPAYCQKGLPLSSFGGEGFGFSKLLLDGDDFFFAPRFVQSFDQILRWDGEVG